jgi:hypothetical protein
MLTQASNIVSRCLSATKRFLTNTFKPSPAEKPGFILYDTVDQLRSTAAHHSTLPTLTPFQSWQQTRTRMPLAKVRSRRGLEMAIKEYENQEPLSVVGSIKGQHQQQLGQSRLATGTLEGAIAEAMVVNDVLASEHDLTDPTVEPSDARAKTPMSLMSILKWRKRRMRGHKYQKRMRRNRYKTKL